MQDVPKITQRSIVAYSAITGTPLSGEWYPAALRRSFAVSSLTAATLRITASTLGSRARAVVSGSSINIECKFISPGEPGISYGVSDRGVLTLEVTTAGDAGRGIAGATKVFTVNVLVLDYDMPYAGDTFLTFRRGEMIARKELGTVKVAGGAWTLFAANTGYGIAVSGGQKIVGNYKVNGDYVDSGLVLHCDAETEKIWLSGTAARPGVYRVYFDLMSTQQGFGEGGQVYFPFAGGPGQCSLVIRILEDYRPGDLMLLLPARNAEPADKYHFAAAHAPSWSGIGDALPEAEFTRAEESGTVKWRGIAAHYSGGVLTYAYHYLIFRDGATWKLYGADTNSTTPPELADMTLYATAAARNFADEQPPKQGWSDAALVFTGDEGRYLPPPGAAAADPDNSGWYDYAGTITLTPPGENAEPVALEVREREMHYTPAYSGWTGGGIADTGARYLLDIAGAWRVTANVADLSAWSTASALPEVEPQAADARIAVPFCPAKAGDLGALLDVPAIVPGAAPARVLHSLSNRFAAAGELALLMDGIAGAMWRRYPLRRLLSLFDVGATVVMHFAYSSSHTKVSNQYSGFDVDNTGDYADGVPSVAQIENVPGDPKSITVSQLSRYSKEYALDEHYSAETDVEFELSYALWNGSFPAYLDAILNRSTSHTNTSGSYSHDETERDNGSGGTTSTYKVDTITEAEAIARGIPFAGDGQGGGNWQIVSGTATEVITEIESGAEVASYHWTYHADIQQWVEDDDDPAGGTPNATVDSSGLVTVWFDDGVDGGVEASGQGTASATGSWEGEGQFHFAVSITAVAKSDADSPGATGPHAGVPTANGVKVVFAARQTIGGPNTVKTLGNASTAGVSNVAAHGTASVFFGEGRECNWPHRSVCATGDGEGGFSCRFSTANAQRDIETTIRHGGIRSRSSIRNNWTYDAGSEATWGTSTTTTETDTTLPATVGASVNVGHVFHTGVVRLLFAYAMGSLNFSYSSTSGSASGTAYGSNEADTEHADVTPVSGSWSSTSESTTNGPGKDESSGEDVSGDVDLSGEVEDGGWYQWGYQYEIQTATIRASMRIEIHDADFPAPEQNED